MPCTPEELHNAAMALVDKANTLRGDEKIQRAGRARPAGGLPRWDENKMLVLSIFPGIDILGLGFEMEGFTVVRGPDPMWGKLHDIRRFHPPAGVFQGVIGGPPCQAHSNLAYVVRKRYGEDAVAENMIPEFSRVVLEAQPDWFLMENVPGAPDPETHGYAVFSFTLNLRHLGHVQNRVRRFWFGVRGEKEPVDLRKWVPYAALEPAEWAPAVLASGIYRAKRGKMRLNAKRGPSQETVRESLRLQGLPEDFFNGTPFTVKGQQMLIGNAVPLPMARALAKAIKSFLLEGRVFA